MEPIQVVNRSKRDRCDAFWGPTTPFWGDDAEDAALSHYIPTTVFLVARFMLLCFVGILLSVIIGSHFDMMYLANWSLCLFALSFSALTLCTALYIFDFLNTANAIAQFFVPIYFVAATNSLYVNIFYVMPYHPPLKYGDIATHGVTFVLHLIDSIVLGARYRFRVQHMILVIAYAAIYLVFMIIRFAAFRNLPGYEWPYKILSPSKGPKAWIAYAILVLWLVVSGIITILTTRARCVCGRKTPKVIILDSDDDEDDDARDYQYYA